VRILVATGLTQGVKHNDYNHCVEGELVWIQEACSRDKDDPDGACGCGRGFAGVASHRATTTAMVVESEMSREEMVLAFRTSLRDGGWPVEWAEGVADENLEIASWAPVGTVIERRLDDFCVRAVRLGG
jgi:hypothetical protein